MLVLGKACFRILTYPFAEFIGCGGTDRQYENCQSFCHGILTRTLYSRKLAGPVIANRTFYKILGTPINLQSLDPFW